MNYEIETYKVNSCQGLAMPCNKTSNSFFNSMEDKNKFILKQMFFLYLALKIIKMFVVNIKTNNIQQYLLQQG